MRHFETIKFYLDLDTFNILFLVLIDPGLLRIELTNANVSLIGSSALLYYSIPFLLVLRIRKFEYETVNLVEYQRCFSVLLKNKFILH